MEGHSSLPNPLKEVALPASNIAKLKELQQKMPVGAKRSHIFMHLLLGEQGEAMLIARRLLLDDPALQGSTAVLEMARIFKANDLNMVRANALLQYMQTGAGLNPIDEFFKQHPVKRGM